MLAPTVSECLSARVGVRVGGYVAGLLPGRLGVGYTGRLIGLSQG
jgi:hypothetical protein